MTKDLKKELINIAHSYGVKVRFKKNWVIPSADVQRKILYIAELYHSDNLIMSEFFHELGHIVDCESGVYRGYYKSFPTKKYLRRFAVQAEMHTDIAGAKLMKKHYPAKKFIHTYKYKYWQKWLRKDWGI